MVGGVSKQGIRKRVGRDFEKVSLDLMEPKDRIESVSSQVGMQMKICGRINACNKTHCAQL